MPYPYKLNCLFAFSNEYSLSKGIGAKAQYEKEPAWTIVGGMTMLNLGLKMLFQMDCTWGDRNVLKGQLL